MPTILWRPSLCKSGTLSPRYIMLHHTANTNFEAAVRYMRSLTNAVSAHYCVGKAGEIAQLVPLNRKAWHAGQGGPYQTIPRNQGNAYCIGIEIVNKGDGKDPFPEAQLKALDWLINHIDNDINRALPIIDHKAYTSRKVDMAANFPLATYAKYRCHQPPEWERAMANTTTVMRARRSAKSEALRTIRRGSILKVYSKTAIWCYAEYGKERGYVLTSKLTFEELM